MSQEELKKKVAIFAEKAGLKPNAASAILKKLMDKHAGAAGTTAAEATTAGATPGASESGTPPSTPVTPAPRRIPLSGKQKPPTAPPDSPMSEAKTSMPGPAKGSEFIKRVSDMADSCGLTYEKLLQAAGVTREGLKSLDNLPPRTCLPWSARS